MGDDGTLPVAAEGSSQISQAKAEITGIEVVQRDGQFTVEEGQEWARITQVPRECVGHTVGCGLGDLGPFTGSSLLLCQNKVSLSTAALYLLFII